MFKMKYLLREFFLLILISMGVAVCGQSKLDVRLYQVSLKQGEACPLKPVPLENSQENVEWKNRIYIQPEISFQTIEGIGGAFNEIGGEAFMALEKSQRKKLINMLFSSDEAGFSFCRTAMGASDFGLDAYAYSEVAEDYEMKYFSIDRDLKYVLPYISSAFEINPDLILFASPWSPPAWMKINGSMTGLTKESNSLRKEEEVLEAYAKYFVKYIEAYADHGVNIDRICIQNENDANTKYPSCIFPVREMIAFANAHLIPAFHESKIQTDIYAGTFRAVDNLDLMDFVQTSGKEGLKGVGVQYTDARFIADARYLCPELAMFHTEGDCYNGANSPEEAAHRLEEVASYINSGLTAFTYWNMILNETTKSGWDWPQNSLINVDREKKTVQYNPDYNAMYIISHFIRPGDVRVASVCRGKHPMITVKDSEGKIKVLVQNTLDESKTFEVLMNGKSWKMDIPANAITAIVISK